MRTLDITKVDISLRKATETLGEAPLVLTRKGRPFAVLLPTGNADLETISLNLNPEFQDMLERSRRSGREGTMTLEEVRRAMGIERSAKNGAPRKLAKKRPTKS